MQDVIRLMFPETLLLTAYGMTEACSSMTFRVVFSPLRYNSMIYPEAQGDVSSTWSSGFRGNTHMDFTGSCVGYPAPGVQVTITPLSTELQPDQGAGVYQLSMVTDEQWFFNLDESFWYLTLALPVLLVCFQVCSRGGVDQRTSCHDGILG
jgi:hypothetical protein